MLLTIVFIALYSIKGQENLLLDNKPLDLIDTIVFKQIKTDTLYKSNQIISLLSMKNDSKNYFIKFDYNKNDLMKTSLIANNNGAVAAINGGFFDMDKGGSVTYFEINDTTISDNKSKNNKWGNPKNLLNGAIVISKNNKIQIGYANQENYYKTSKEEKAVLVTGPVLLLDSKKVKMPDKKFVRKRHPRTCLCTTENSIILIAIDGRQSNAQGMTLYEIQDYLKSLNCVNAINLDGGGSTTMWIQGKGIVNFPSDKTGERPVSNILSIYEK